MGGRNIEIIVEENKREQIKKEKIKQGMSKDTNDRVKIHERIIKLVQLGFPKDQILIRLKEEFSGSKHEEFFESWVEHHYKHKDIQKIREETRINKFDYKGYDR